LLQRCYAAGNGNNGLLLDVDVFSQPDLFPDDQPERTIFL
jgi:hypothetical protein